MSKIEIFKGKDGYYFKIIDEDNSVLLISESYTAKAKAKKGAESLLKNIKTPNGIHKKTAKNGKLFYTIRSKHNGKILAKSSPYSSRTGREWGISKAKKAKIK